MKAKKVGPILLVAAVLMIYGAAAATAATFVTRICRVAPLDAQAASRLHEAVAQRIEAREQLPPAQDGYQILGDYLQDCCQEDNVLRAIRETHPCCRGKVAPKTDPVVDARMHREAFAAILPTLRKVVKAPYFVFPSPIDRGSEEVPSLGCIRILADELKNEGQLAMKNGDVGAAAEYFLIAFEMGTKLGAGGAVQVHQTSLSIRLQALNGLVSLLAEKTVNDATVSMINKRLGAHPDDPLELVNSMDEQFNLGLNTLESIKNHTTPRELEGLMNNSFCSCRDPWTTRALDAALMALPQYLDREQTVYENTYLMNRPYLVRMQDPEDVDPGLSSAAQRRVLAASYSTIAAFLLPDISCRMVMHKACQTYLAGTRTLLALRMYHQDHHSYPASLQALVPAYMGAVPVDTLNPSGQFVYEPGPSGFTLQSVSPKYRRLCTDERFQARVGDDQGTAVR